MDFSLLNVFILRSCHIIKRAFIKKQIKQIYITLCITCFISVNEFLRYVRKIYKRNFALVLHAAIHHLYMTELPLRLEHPRIARLRPLLLGWLLITATALAVVFGLAGSNQIAMPQDQDPLTPAADFFYAAFSSAAWSTVVAWVVLMCALELAGLIYFYFK